VWGAQWLTEPFCILPPESDASAAVIAAGCRDPLGFVPNSVGVSVPLEPGGATTLELAQLPGADVMVGDVTARVAYGSLVVFDDRDGTKALELARPQRTAFGRDGEPPDDAGDGPDVIYGASFVTMTEPDRRLAYREGGPPTGAFYPRAGCPAPRPGFSVLGAGGFTVEAARMATLAGTLPTEDAATCADDAPGATTIDIQARPPSEVGEVGCEERRTDSSTRYREPPAQEPDLTDRVSACAHLPVFDTGVPSTLVQLVVSGRPSDRCKGLTHYTLRGCREDVNCVVPDWDYTKTPPAWWPCAN
jgi:hypothetical protein